MNRLRFPFALLLAVLLAAPQAFAQVPQTAQTDQARMQQERTEMQQRMDRYDRTFTDLERRSAALRDANLRTEQDRDLDRLRQERQTLRTDMERLGTATGDQYHTQRRQVMERMDNLEHGAFQARLRTAQTRDDFRRTVRERLDAQQRMFDERHRHMAQLDDDARAEAALSMIQHRRQYDRLNRDWHRMGRADQAAFNQMRQQYTTQLRDFDRTYREAHRDTMFRDGRHHGMTPPGS
jgi:hypothetical protein